MSKAQARRIVPHMTLMDLRAVIGTLVDAAAQQRLQGDRSYARGLMDAADRLRRYLPPEEAVPRVDADLTVVDVPKAAAKYVAEAPDAVAEPPKRRRIRKPKGI